MNDEITKVFDNFYKEVLGQVGDKTKEAIQEEVDNFSNQFENDLQSSVPKDTGGLAKSLSKRYIKLHYSQTSNLKIKKNFK